LLARNPVRWLAVFGPGAVLASLTIGVGELVFSTRAGALFGYRLLWLFVLVLALKWLLVFGSARHMVLSGAHPFQRWLELPGPRGWFPLAFFLVALPCFPIWVCFHAGTLGTLCSALTGTAGAAHGGAHLLWGAGLLGGTLLLSAMGGYQALERIQLIIVMIMLGAVVVAVFFMQTDWAALGAGLVPHRPVYPEWIASYPKIAMRPVWLETATYAGILGGSAYDYLAYTSYLRDKRWGFAGGSSVGLGQLASLDARQRTELRRWVRAPLVDCTMSFLAVLLFTAVFLIGGATVLGPQQKVPAEQNLLSLQAEFLTVLHPWFRPVYFVGAFLAVLGTLYGTIEVAPAILREMVHAWRPDAAERWQPQLRRWSLIWTGVGGFLVLAWSFLHHWQYGADKAPGLVALLTPANLFTGVLGCGLICLMNSWMDTRFLPADLRPARWLRAASVGAGVIFIGLGFVAYWDHSRWLAFLLLGGTILLGCIGASAIALRLRRARRAPGPKPQPQSA
jgi:hypothetical protein